MSMPTSEQIGAILSEIIVVRQTLDRLYDVQTEVLQTLQDNQRLLQGLASPQPPPRRRTGW